MQEIVEKGLFGLGGLLLGAALMFFGYCRGFFSSDHIKKEEFASPSIFALLIAFIIYFGMQIVALIFGGMFVGSLSTMAKLVKVTIFGLSLAALFLVLFSNLQKIWFRRSDTSILSAFKTAVITWIIAFPIVVGVNNLLSVLVEYVLGPESPLELQDAVTTLKAIQNETNLFIPLAIIIGFVVPIAEEIIFRGYLQTWLCSRFRQSWGIILSSFIFTSFHYSSSQGIANLTILPSLFVLSLFLGFVYLRERTLWAPIMLHALHNTAGVLMIYVQ